MFCHQGHVGHGSSLPFLSLHFTLERGWSAAKANAKFDEMLKDPLVVKGKTGDGVLTCEIEIDRVTTYRNRATKQQSAEATVKTMKGASTEDAQKLSRKVLASVDVSQTRDYALAASCTLPILNANVYQIQPRLSGCLQLAIFVLAASPRTFPILLRWA